MIHEEVRPPDTGNGRRRMDLIGRSLGELHDALNLPPEKVDNAPRLLLCHVVARNPRARVFRKAKNVSIDEGKLTFGFALCAYEITLLYRIADLEDTGFLARRRNVRSSVQSRDLGHRGGINTKGQSQYQQKTQKHNKSQGLASFIPGPVNHDFDLHMMLRFTK